MKNKFLILIIGIALIPIGCTTAGCIVQNRVVNSVTDGVVDRLQCDDREAVKASIESVAGILNLCKKKHEGGLQGPIADAACPFLSTAVSSLVVNNAIPVAWKCKATNAQVGLKEFLEAQCKKLPL